MKRILRYAGAVVGAFVVSAPAAFIVTMILFPFWSWLEETFAIESVGHSGPDDWCYVATYFATALVLSFIAVRWVSRSDREREARPV